MVAAVASLGSRVRHRTVRSKGCLSEQDSTRHDLQAPRGRRENWCRVDGHNLLPKVILGVKFADRVEIVRSQTQAAEPCVTKIRG
jgi:putative transposase